MNHSPTHLRLLPWTGPEGKPAHLVTDGTATPLALLADDIEEQQIETAVVVLGLARPMLEETASLTTGELRFVVRRLCESLTDVLNVAESRGQRVPPYEPDGGAVV
ncbi:hypothetical protein GCM10010145_24050 [Streptomyces ruber]|uniref:Uncharacterized protein n=2 Tax=Streptomyces TaxID=1883 RepID=A0A918EPX8_9ACTN|nr:hypothetical protein [Streptomyces ruber]GGQ53849.1 hypothetical protein GCM10010145_24050 [Streptomyces ruber]